MAMPELIIFDCDGVLVDSEILANRVMTDYLNEVGLPIRLEQTVERFVGMSMASMRKIILAEDGLILPDDFEAEILRRDKIEFATGLQAVRGIDETLRRLSIPSCVASSGSHGKIANSLKLTGLAHHFDGKIFSADDVANGKPAPDLFLHAARQMQVAPHNAIVIEDSPAGAAAGVAANMRVFGFLGGGHITDGHGARLLAAGAERLFDTMADLDGLLN